MDANETAFTNDQVAAAIATEERLGRRDRECAFLDGPVPEQVIRARCDVLGLSLAHAQQLAAVAQSGYADSQALLWVLGLDFATLAPLKPRRWLWMAAKTSSVSYRTEMTQEALLAVLTTGVVPAAFVSPVIHLLDEAAIQLVVMAVEQAAQQSGMPIESIWRNVERIAGIWSRRQTLWIIGE